MLILTLNTDLGVLSFWKDKIYKTGTKMMFELRLTYQTGGQEIPEI